MSFKPKSASVVFYVSDIVRTEKFYNETMGLELTREEGPNRSGCRAGWPADLS
ncbi:VOC family protein [Devosia sp. SL43]|uniref:VOC family protein n=1 Tax=Devosia sp. SL43 TaxID=2806348 RepID=UPI001F353C32|nr:VOC family protein [Devosia sp. SL43]